ncbi:TerB family tellurite resistance protein [Sulfurimonas sp.]|uniref:TerB family tellurite resistance protein n=1 Tax=Sulfurimonas sp. TaxID=2022749 RepID=UPI0035650755
MYLDLLNKQEQEDFLELARYSMGLNGEHKAEEEAILTNYKYECQLVEYIAHRQEDIKKIILTLKGSTKKVKKIILVELFGILLADGEVCEEEAKFVDILAEGFRIKEYEVDRIQRWVEAMNDIVQEGYELISR